MSYKKLNGVAVEISRWRISLRIDLFHEKHQDLVGTATLLLNSNIRSRRMEKLKDYHRYYQLTPTFTWKFLRVNLLDKNSE